MNIIINNSSGEPIYSQIEKQIKDHILMNRLQPHEPLPSIRMLAKELRISVITTKRAYEELESEGYIYTLPGKGSFVCAQDVELVRETIIRSVEEHLGNAIDQGAKINLSLEEMKDILEVLYTEK